MLEIIIINHSLVKDIVLQLGGTSKIAEQTFNCTTVFHYFHVKDTGVDLGKSGFSKYLDVSKS